MFFAQENKCTENTSKRIGINNSCPTATIDINGNARIRQIPEGISSDSILVTNNGFIRKITFSNIVMSSQVCPTLDNESNAYYLKFYSSSSIPNPNNPITVSGLNFGGAGTWVENNKYYFTYTNTSGQPLNVNDFSVMFGTKKCDYKK